MTAAKSAFPRYVACHLEALHVDCVPAGFAQREASTYLELDCVVGPDLDEAVLANVHALDSDDALDRVKLRGLDGQRQNLLFRCASTQ